MTSQELESILDNILYTESIILIPISYNDFKISIDEVKKRLGYSGVAMYTEHNIVLSFDKNPNIRFNLKADKCIVRQDVLGLSLELKILGRSEKEIGSLINIFVKDIADNLIKIIVLTIIFGFLVCPWSLNFNQILTINEKMIDITSVFLGMLFVFIGFFYGDKENAIKAYQENQGDKQFQIDRYVIKLAILTIVLNIVSLLLGNLQETDVPKILVNNLNNNLLGLTIIQYVLCLVLTWLSIVFSIICFDSLINYYLRDIRYRHFKDAFNDLVDKRKKY